MALHDEEFEVPAKLREELKGLYGVNSARGMEGRDGEVLAAARRAGEGARRRRWAIGWIAAAAGVAAAVAAELLPMWREKAHLPVAPAVTAYVRTGDIRDAFYVARELKAGVKGKALEVWDVNGDGVVDEKDVDMLAMRAVKVERGTP